MKHDICYRDTPLNKHECDRIMLQKLSITKPDNFREHFDKLLVKNIIKKKYNWKI